MKVIEKRIDFVYFFDVKLGNPNGDPDAANSPRMDQETMHGLVSDVCLKRHCRNYVTLLHGYEAPNSIYIRDGSVLSETNEEILSIKGKNPAQELCKRFWDVRTFGAVASAKTARIGTFTGPVQVCFGRSIHPISIIDLSIIRCCVSSPEEAKEQREKNGEIIGTVGRKFVVPYALYRSHGFISPSLSKKTGFSEEDQNLFFEALMKMFESSRSASRGEMTARGLYKFVHNSALGNARASDLFQLISVSSNVETPRGFEDYKISVEKNRVPHGVSLEMANEHD